MLAAKKGIRKNLLFNGYGDIFASSLIQYLDFVGGQWVHPLVVDSSSKGLVVRDLKEILKQKRDTHGTLVGNKAQNAAISHKTKSIINQ